jgi:hypothetical protein
MASKSLLLTFILVSAYMGTFCQSGENYTTAAIAAEMAATNVYEQSPTVGYGGIKSRQIELFDHLSKTATGRELQALARTYDNAAVRLSHYKHLGKIVKNYSMRWWNILVQI